MDALTLTRTAVTLAGLLALVFGMGCPATLTDGREAEAAEANRFATDGLWDDGQAEINAYEAVAVRYGIPRPFTAYHIIVKEDHSREQPVKADPGHHPSDLITMLKMNQVIEFQTGIYAYRQMLSTFHERASMNLLKLSLTSYEWCGNTYKEYARRDGRGALHVHTYWDGEAEETYRLPTGPDVLFYDELPLRVRSLPQVPGTARTLELVSGQVSSRGPKPTIAPAELRSITTETVETPAGAFQALRWDLKGESGVDRFWTATDFPHQLVAWDRHDGGSYRLRWSQRQAYWTLNQPGDEQFLNPDPSR